MKSSSIKATRLRKLSALSHQARVVLYGRALEAWTSSLEQREIDQGTPPAQARLNVRDRHEAALRQGYPAQAKAERDAFVDTFVAAAVA